MANENSFHDLVRLAETLLGGGGIDMPTTATLLRCVKPYTLRGDLRAAELQTLLEDIREDGRIDPDEGERLISMLKSLSERRLTLADYVRVIPDFPKPGVVFRDVTGILDNGEGMRLALEEIAETLDGVSFDVVAAPESRGFIFGAAIAARFGKAFVPVRKPGKLPRATVSEDYDLEYGKATLHMHADAIIPGERALVVDDLLATGGTAAAVARLVERLGGAVVKMIFPIELAGFGAREKLLGKYDVVSLVKYEGK